MLRESLVMRSDSWTHCDSHRRSTHQTYKTHKCQFICFYDHFVCFDPELHCVYLVKVFLQWRWLYTVLPSPKTRHLLDFVSTQMFEHLSKPNCCSPKTKRFGNAKLINLLSGHDVKMWKLSFGCSGSHHISIKMLFFADSDSFIIVKTKCIIWKVIFERCRFWLNELKFLDLF